MEALGDPRKIFLFPFSRGVADTYHAIKDFDEKQKNRLIITACGGIMVIPRSCGFIVNNFISEGDRCSKIMNGISNIPFKRKEVLDRFAETSNLRILEQLDSDGLNEDHFFLSKTYQKMIQDQARPLYQQYGVLK